MSMGQPAVCSTQHADQFEGQMPKSDGCPKSDGHRLEKGPLSDCG